MFFETSITTNFPTGKIVQLTLNLILFKMVKFATIGSRELCLMKALLTENKNVKTCVKQTVDVIFSHTTRIQIQKIQLKQNMNVYFMLIVIEKLKSMEKNLQPRDLNDVTIFIDKNYLTIRRKSRNLSSIHSHRW